MSKLPSQLSRRSFLYGGSAGLLLAAGGAEKLKVVVAGGHPGDPEYGCGGTVARYTQEGHQVALLYLNHGQKGCSGATEVSCASIRSAEGAHASQILGAQPPQFAKQVDGDAVVDKAHYDAFRTQLSDLAPDVVFTHWPVDNHRDHRAMSMLVYDAWLNTGKRFSLYYYEVSDGEDTMMFSPTDYVDITATEKRKRAACYAHASQTPDKFYDLQLQVSRFRGVQSGYAQAEAFIRHTQSPGHPLP